MVFRVVDAAVALDVLGHVARRVELVLLARPVGDAVGRGADGWIGTDQALCFRRVPAKRLRRPRAHRAVAIPVVAELLPPIGRGLAILLLCHRRQSVQLVVRVSPRGVKAGHRTQGRDEFRR